MATSISISISISDAPGRAPPHNDLHYRSMVQFMPISCLELARNVTIATKDSKLFHHPAPLLGRQYGRSQGIELGGVAGTLRGSKWDIQVYRIFNMVKSHLLS